MRAPDKHPRGAPVPPTLMMSERADGSSGSTGPSQAALATTLGADLASWIFTTRRLRDDTFGPGLFSDPAWDILLDLYAARARGEKVQVSSVSPMSGVPPSTARRWVRKLIELRLLERSKDRNDRRLSFVKLTDEGAGRMSSFFEKLSERAERPRLQGNMEKRDS